ncbi:MAG: porin family protein [Bacteroidales bacterium]|nr:porin family protein [Bacteroidales bacterium]
MKLIVLLTATAVIFSASAFAQDISFGVKAGVNFSKFSEKIDGTKANDYAKSKPGICLGAYADYNLTDMFALEAGLQFEQKGGKYEFSEEDVKEIDKESISYFTIPVNFRANFAVNDNTAYLLAGPTFGIGLSGKYKSECTEDGETTKNDGDLKFGDNEDSDFHRMNVGLLFGAGFEMSNNIGFRLSYEIGLSNLQPKGDSKNSTKTGVLGLAVTYKF